RAAQRNVAAVLVEALDLAGCQVDGLDAATLIPVGRESGEQVVSLARERQAAVVADVCPAIVPDRHAVRASAEFRDDADLAVRDAAPRLARDLDDEEAAVVERDRPFREPESARDLANHG